MQDLMAYEFDYMGTVNVSPSDVFKDLGLGQWNNLESAVQSRVFLTQDYRGKPAKLLRCTPLDVDHSCYLVFQTDSSRQWRWKAMLMPRKPGR